ncbi:Site-specific recombinase XerD [Fimbriiglobus ruber]|uniref:Site-specific recombinase XerD n=1 Tax=Fimbriiglobus ruber TaxID=1908690 RepID=A0A225E438_9BACT|nr:Site-specific recombinase XerD [Fimbriiglobus ruber]
MLEAASGAANTYLAKRRDLNLFLGYFRQRMNSDAPDDWTKPVTVAFLRFLETAENRKASTVNRTLASLRHCAAWIHERRPFLAGNPCRGVRELFLDEPAWKGLSDLQVMQLRSAAEQLVCLKKRKNQRGLRDRAIFLSLLHTGLRVSELLAVQKDQYTGRHLVEVRRKGKIRTAKVFLPGEARDVLDAYLIDCRGDRSGPLFLSKAGEPMARQHVDRLLRQLARQASCKLSKDEQIALSAHVLRHTMLRRITEKHGVQFAMEATGHISSKYIWRYVKPSDEEREKAMEELF